jgi:pentatricopeptide repeat protein
VDVSTIFQNTIVETLNARASIFAPEEGSSCVHEQIIQSGCKADVFVGTSFVFMYANCGSREDAWRVFNKMSSHDMVT